MALYSCVLGVYSTCDFTTVPLNSHLDRTFFTLFCSLPIYSFSDKNTLIYSSSILSFNSGILDAVLNVSDMVMRCIALGGVSQKYLLQNGIKMFFRVDNQDQLWLLWCDMSVNPRYMLSSRCLHMLTILAYHTLWHTSLKRTHPLPFLTSPNSSLIPL